MCENARVVAGGSQEGQEVPKMLPRGTQEAPRGSQGAPGGLKRLPRGVRRPPRGLRDAQSGPRRLPRVLKRSLRCSQDANKRLPRGHSGPQEVLRGPQEPPRGSREAPRSPQEVPKSIRNRFRSASLFELHFPHKLLWISERNRNSDEVRNRAPV